MGEYTTKLHLYKPTLAENVSLADHFNANWDELESRLGDLYGITEAEAQQVKNIGTNSITATRWGYVAGLTTHPLGGDGTAGRILREIFVKIEDGTNAETLKCTVTSYWNGDPISATDNIAKGATTGHFILNAAGTAFEIVSTGLSGLCVAAIGVVSSNASEVNIIGNIYPSSNNIEIVLENALTAVLQDITTLVDTGIIYVTVLYITVE